ncbi:hypothetical protein [Nocardioides sp. Leaf285]|uniref:hypothetical protein n=1 Tax=Nocardioides sp. Leaf285 TaxID=1736322 RepID=UPI0007031454|nr:hypothetical protein [Nocardioides sp. Leaf285]KQP63140.1 hypothetical protein ASF47_19210 [Nocardioides sp. Leaf285]
MARPSPRTPGSSTVGTDAAREAARRANGEFGTQARGEAQVNLGDATADPTQADPAGPDYTTWEPVAIDEELARLYDEHGTLMQRWASDYKHLNGEIARHKFGRGWRGTCTRAEMAEAIEEMQRAADEAEARGERPDFADRDILRHVATAEERRLKAREVKEAMEPLNAEFVRRGGWARAYLVVNVNGHVHSSMECSTCFSPGYDGAGNYREGTRFHWVTQMSDRDESEIVEAAGERACTTCYPTAPTETLNKPTSLYTPDEERKAAERVEREKAKIERERIKIAKSLTEDGSELRIDVGTRYPERFKTEQAATSWAVDRVMMARNAAEWAREMSEAEQAGVETIKEAIVAKRTRDGGDRAGADAATVRAEVEAEFDKKIRAKAKREGITLAD